MMFKKCPYCGAHLDFGEKCDCKEDVNEKTERVKNYEKKLKVERDGQIMFRMEAT